jgi:hypothetical protein
MPATPEPPRLVNTRRFFMSYMTDKVDDVVHLLSPEVTYTVPGQSLLSGVCHGPDEVKRHLALVLEFSMGTIDVLQWVDWLVGESHVVALLYLQLQRKSARFRGHLVYLVETDHNDALTDIKVLFENEEEANRFFSA